MTKPIIHLNGSGKDNLLNGYTEVIDKVGELREALAKTSPHPRDYYVHPDPDAFNKARQEHINRLTMLDTIEQEITDLGLHVIENS